MTASSGRHALGARGGLRTKGKREKDAGKGGSMKNPEQIAVGVFGTGGTRAGNHFSKKPPALYGAEVAR